MWHSTKNESISDSNTQRLLPFATYVTFQTEGVRPSSNSLHHFFILSSECIEDGEIWFRVLTLMLFIPLDSRYWVIVGSVTKVRKPTDWMLFPRRFSLANRFKVLSVLFIFSWHELGFLDSPFCDNLMVRSHFPKHLQLFFRAAYSW